MSNDNFDKKIEVTVLGPWGPKKIKITRGISLAEALDLADVGFSDRLTAKLDGIQIDKASEKLVLIDQPDSLITIVGSHGTSGEAPTPLVQKAEKMLRKMGYTEGGGKGDHKKYTAPDGKTVVLNPDKRDKKHLDIGSTKSLAKHLSKSISELYTHLS